MSEHPLLPIEEALARVLAQAKPLPSEPVLLTAAHGRVLAEAAAADLDQPAFDRGAMDGIAVRAADCAEPGALLRMLGEAAAGAPFAGTVTAGHCVRIMTGGVVPTGADAVVPVERLVEEPSQGATRVFRVLDTIRPERHIARRGSEVRASEPVVAAGLRLHGARIGVLATFGHVTVSVYRKPRVTVLPTGNEIVGISETPGPGQVRDANRHALTGLLLAAGADVLQGPIAPDRRDALAQTIREALQVSDVVVLSGGVSAGDYDLVAPALADLGATAHFHQIRIKPGKPLLFATLADATGTKLIFGLPGNPISAYVCCALFVAPALEALQGRPGVGWQTFALPSVHALPAVGPRTELAPARLVSGSEGTAVELLPVRGSADLAHFAEADWWVLRQADAPQAMPGTLVDVLAWPRP